MATTEITQTNLTAGLRPVWLLTRGIIALSLLVPALLVTASPVAAAHSLAASTTCNNGVGGGGGQGVICEVTIVNTITASGGSATVTVHECIGSAGAPLSGVCSTTTQELSTPVSTVTQCNGTVEGGGGTLRCSINITNNYVGVSPGASTVTVNQCIGSGGGITTGCDPLQSTTSAVITQCNGTANGGSLVGLTCTATGTMSATFGMTVNQCNASANGGGALVICSTELVNNVTAVTSPAPTTTPTTPTTTRTTAPTTAITAAPSSTGDAPVPSSTPLLPLMLLLGLSGLGIGTLVTQRRRLDD
ncbi:MAG TPA: hypothetical protein VF337_01700 [Candidatus Limnocylindrales bacterium]